MKTKEQVLKHLMEVGYTKKAINRIMGFLLGQGLKTPDETITYMKGDRPFKDFYKWYNSKEVKKSKLEAYKEIVDFLMSNVKDVPLYWLEYLNDDIKFGETLEKIAADFRQKNKEVKKTEKKIECMFKDIDDIFQFF